MIDFAAAVAAVTCTRFPGVLNAPTYDEVSAFVSAAKQNDPSNPARSLFQ